MAIDQDQSRVAREHLLSVDFNARIDHIEAHRVTLQPGQKSGSHVHAGGVVGYVLDGEVLFATQGQNQRTLGPGDAFFEPPGVPIAHFDNASETAAAIFIAFYPLAGAQGLISMSDESLRRHEGTTAVIDTVSTSDVTLSVEHRAASGQSGARRALLFLHGWPGTRSDWSAVRDGLLGASRWDRIEFISPDLRGFGASEKPPADFEAAEPFRGYTPAAHLGDLVAILEHYDVHELIVAGFDLGANLAQALARLPDSRVHGLLLCDPVHPAARAAAASMNLEKETWYQQLHLQTWAPDFIAHDRVTLETYLRHFYTHWWGSGAVDEGHFQRLVDVYAQPGAFEASIAWYRARAGSRIREARDAVEAPLLLTPAEVVWGEADPITPVVFADTLSQSFGDYHLTRLPDVGHFAPLEDPRAVIDALDRLARRIGWQ